MWKHCSVCSSPASVRAAVDSALAKHEKLRDIAHKSGFSKSAVHRHSQKCVARNVLSSHKAHFARGGKFFAWFPNQPFPTGLRDGDFVLEIIYAEPLSQLADDDALTHTEAP